MGILDIFKKKKKPAAAKAKAGEERKPEKKIEKKPAIKKTEVRPRGKSLAWEKFWFSLFQFSLPNTIRRFI